MNQTKENNERCRHRNMWVLAGGYWWWCYQCGAIRQATTSPPNHTIAKGNWIKPVGKGGANPAYKTEITMDWRVLNHEV